MAVLSGKERRQQNCRRRVAGRVQALVKLDAVLKEDPPAQVVRHEWAGNAGPVHLPQKHRSSRPRGAAGSPGRE